MATHPCPDRDSNPDALWGHTVHSRACLPVSPSGQGVHRFPGEHDAYTVMHALRVGAKGRGARTAFRHRFIALHANPLRRERRRVAAGERCARALRVSVESDSGPLGGFGFEYLAERIEYRLELAVVPALKSIDSVSQFRVAGDGLPKPYERPDDSDADGDRLRAAQDG